MAKLLLSQLFFLFLSLSRFFPSRFLSLLFSHNLCVTTSRIAGSRKRISFISADWINRRLHSVTSGESRCAELIVLFVSLRELGEDAGGGRYIYIYIPEYKSQESEIHERTGVTSLDSHYGYCRRTSASCSPSQEQNLLPLFFSFFSTFKCISLPLARSSTRLVFARPFAQR